MAQEESIKERMDGEGNKRREVYFGEGHISETGRLSTKS
jgi:hypothetical protein